MHSARLNVRSPPVLRRAIQLGFAALLVVVSLLPTVAGAVGRDRSRVPDEVLTARTIGLDALANAPPVIRESIAVMPNAEAVRLIVAAHSATTASEAEQLYRRALSVLNSEAEQPHRWGVLHLLSSLMWDRLDAEAADQLSREAYDIAMRHYPADSPAVFYSVQMRAWTYAARGQSAEALPLMEKLDALLERRTARARQPFDQVMDRAEVGQLWVDLKEFERGGRRLREVLADANFERLAYYTRARVVGRLGVVDIAQNNPEQAIGHLEAALSFWNLCKENGEPWDQKEVAQVRIRLGDQYVSRDALEAAVEQYTAAADDYAAVRIPANRAKALLGVGSTLGMQKQYVSASKALAEAYALFKDHDPRDPLAFVTAGFYGTALINLQDYATAERVLSESLEGFERLGMKMPAIQSAHSLGRAHALAGHSCEAHSAYQKARTLLDTLDEAERAQDAKLTERVILSSNISICNP